MHTVSLILQGLGVGGPATMKHTLASRDDQRRSSPHVAIGIAALFASFITVFFADPPVARGDEEGQRNATASEGLGCIRTRAFVKEVDQRFDAGPPWKYLLPEIWKIRDKHFPSAHPYPSSGVIGSFGYCDEEKFENIVRSSKYIARFHNGKEMGHGLMIFRTCCSEFSIDLYLFKREQPWMQSNDIPWDGRNTVGMPSVGWEK